MALVHANFFSEALGLSVAVDVILPQVATKQIGMAATVREGKTPVLWLLHGASDNHTIWQRRTSVERYVADLGIAVVMPNAHLSRYTDMVHGGKYFTYIADELPVLMRGFFPLLSDRREDNFIAGLSMGGYGCLKIGLSRPNNYAAIGSFSAGNFIRHSGGNSGMNAMVDRVYGLKPGETAEGTKHDIVQLAKDALAAGGPLPRIYQACGTEDFVYDSYANVRDFFKSLPGNPFGYVNTERPGKHEWSFWDDEIQSFLKFIDLPQIEGVRN
jgi:S-formylglutathione hydrolase FrmB